MAELVKYVSLSTEEIAETKSLLESLFADNESVNPEAFYSEAHVFAHVFPRSYTPRYDGTDRWLKRLTITRDLRKSRELRNKPESKVIKPLDVFNTTAAGGGTR